MLLQERMVTQSGKRNLTSETDCFSISASVLKLMIQRDFNLVTENEIMRVMESKAANLQR